MKRADPFPALLRAFFYEWMVEQRNASAHTVRSYRDTWRLFLRFVAARRRRPTTCLRFVLSLPRSSKRTKHPISGKWRDAASRGGRKGHPRAPHPRRGRGKQVVS